MWLLDGLLCIICKSGGDKCVNLCITFKIENFVNSWKGHYINQLFPTLILRKLKQNKQFSCEGELMIFKCSNSWSLFFVFHLFTLALLSLHFKKEALFLVLFCKKSVIPQLVHVQKNIIFKEVATKLTAKHVLPAANSGFCILMNRVMIELGMFRLFFSFFNSLRNWANHDRYRLRPSTPTQLCWSSSRLQPLQNYNLIKLALIRPST